jgi:hypothetical protein
MAFFVVRRAADSVLSLPFSEAHTSREAALRALSEAAESGTVDLAGEFFVVDLGSAAPVLILQHTPTAGAPEQAAQEHSPLAGFSDESSLAAALKRAASSLEGEGIVAPESVEASEDEVEELSEAAEEVPAVADEAPAVASEEETPASGERTWPWTNVEAYSGEPESEDAEDTEDEQPGEPVSDDGDTVDAQLAEAAPAEEEMAEAEQEVVEEPRPAEAVAEPMGVAEADEELATELYGLTGADPAPLGEDSPIITSAPSEGEEAYIPRPVILGDYADSEVVGDDDEDDQAADPAEAPPTADLASSPVIDAATPSIVEEMDEISAAIAAAPAYEAAGDLDLGEYTCQDCVYSNTCPKVGESSPADCGSFQWRAE